MDNIIVLLLTGFLIGTLGTLIGAGGGFLLVPLLLFTKPDLSPEIVTAISIAVVACNALSGSLAYARSGRIDFKAGLTFALFTIPGSVLGVKLVKYIPLSVFNILFGMILIALSVFLFFKKTEKKIMKNGSEAKIAGLTHRTIIDSSSTTYSYSYNKYIGIAISILVGFISPILGIGGGIIHVPAMVHWLSFPVYIATATSHFILAIMSVASVIMHAIQGNYSDPAVLRMVIYLSGGVIGGAQLGAFLSHRVKSLVIIKSLAVCLGLVGLRIFLKQFIH